MKLLSDNPWRHITTAVKRSSGQCHVAVAYFGAGASRLLPLRQGSRLVLDFSEGAVRAGHACPREVLALLRRGVEVHSVTNLHAKVFVAGTHVFVGSTNASRSSEGSLIEAVVHSTDRSLHRQAVRFVKFLGGDPVGPDYARQLVPLWQPQGRSRGPRRSRARVSPTHSRTWVVQLAHVDWDPEDEAARAKGTPTARRRLARPRFQEVEEFCWSSADFSRRVKRGDLVVQVLQEGSRRYLVSPPQRVLHLQNYRSARGGRRSLVFLEKPKGLRRRTLAQLRRSLGRNAAVLRPKSSLTLLRDDALKHQLLQVWA